MQILTSRIRLLVTMLAVSAVAILDHRAQAATYSSAASGDWNSPATWGQTTLYPSLAADLERVQNGNTVSVSGTSNGGELTLAYDTAGNTSTLSVGSGGALTLNGNVDIGYTGGDTGLFKQSGGAVTIAGTDKLYVGTSSTNDTTASASGEYDFSGGTLVQGATSTACIGYSATGDYASTGTFSVIGNSSGSSISLGYFSAGEYDGSAATAGTGYVKFAIGSSGVTPIDVSRIYLPTASTGGTANLEISLISAPAETGGVPANVTLIGGATFSSGGAFSNYAQGSTVTASFPGAGTYVWTLTYTGGAGHDVDLIGDSFVASSPEPTAAVPLATALLLFMGFRPTRKTLASLR